MILSRWQLVLTPTPHLHPLPFSNGRGDPSPGRRRACPTTCFDGVLVTSAQLPLRRALATASRLWSRATKKISCFPAFLIHSAFGRMSVIARSQACRLEFQRRICAQYPPATGCSREMPGSSARNQRAFQNRDSSAA
jgi:hypothetical protein